jgi:DNA-binding NarL/FixJ family response regulator
VAAALPDTRLLLETVRVQQPSLLVLDIGLPDVTGLEAARQVRADGYSGPILFVSFFLNPATLKEAEEVGQGFLYKAYIGESLCSTAQKVFAGERCFPELTDTEVEPGLPVEPGGPDRS